MQKANPRWPFRIRRPRRGADAAFAKAMARSEFGRFYTDDCQLQEVRRSLARAKAPGKNEDGLPDGKKSGQPPAPAKKEKATVWHRPRVRERRTEIAEAMARLREARKDRQ